MHIDGEKLRRFREEAGMTQEKLAAMSRVNERTIQRAEAGSTLSAESVAQIAAALGKQPRDFRRTEAPNSLEVAGDEGDEPNRVVLHRTHSAKDALSLFSSSYAAEIECDVEPDDGNVSLLAAFADVLYRLAPEPTPESGPYDDNAISSDGASPLSRRLKTTAALNKDLAAMSDAGIGLFTGSYIKMVTVPAYSMDEGCWFTDSSMRPEPVRIAVLRIADAQRDKIVVWARDAVLAEPPAQVADNNVQHFSSSFADIDDEIPF